MKIPALRKKIIVNSIALGILFLILLGIIFYNYNQQSNIGNKVDKIKSEAQQTRSQATMLKGKLTEAKKYKELWSKITENKKSTSGIKMDEINTKLEALAIKNNIFNPVIKVTLPEPLKDGIFNRASFNVIVASASLSFESINDVNALLFINDFFAAIPGYAIITNLDIKKIRKYEEKDFVAITSGKPFGIVTVMIDFFWYSYKEKAPDKSKDVKPNDNQKEKGGANAPI